LTGKEGAFLPLSVSSIDKTLEMTELFAILRGDSGTLLFMLLTVIVALEDEVLLITLLLAPVLRLVLCVLLVTLGRRAGAGGPIPEFPVGFD
jgi:hypothetical protein